MYKVVEITESKMIAGEVHYDNVGHHLVILVDGQGNEHMALPEYFCEWEEAVSWIAILNGKPDPVKTHRPYGFGGPFR